MTYPMAPGAFRTPPYYSVPRHHVPSTMAGRKHWAQRESDRHYAGNPYARYEHSDRLVPPQWDPAYTQQFAPSRYQQPQAAPAPSPSPEFSIADQPARFAKQKAENNVRALDIDFAGYDSTAFTNKRVLVTGATRGLGLAMVKELAKNNAIVVAVCRKANAELHAALAASDAWRGHTHPHQIIEGIDVTSTSAIGKMVAEVGAPVDVVINNAGYFYEPKETFENLNFEEELKMIDICALGPLRVTQALFNAGLMLAGCKVAMITSQGGSIAWRDTQCPDGGDYGHHMSKAAANMMGKLVSNELKSKGVMVSILHPGFNKTEMTAKYSEIWAIEGAVDASVGAKRTLHEIKLMTMKTTGSFINCEDGLCIPW